MRKISTRRLIKRQRYTFVEWEPLSRLQLSNVTESQTRGASCVVPGLRSHLSLLPLFPLRYQRTTTPQWCPFHLRFSSAARFLPFCSFFISPPPPSMHHASSSLPSCARFVGGDSSTYWLLRSFGNSALCRSRFPIVISWIYLEDASTIHSRLAFNKKFFMKSVSYYGGNCEEKLLAVTQLNIWYDNEDLWSIIYYIVRINIVFKSFWQIYNHYYENSYLFSK